MRALSHQHTDKRDDVQHYEKKDRWREDDEKFFLKFLEYLVHGTPLFTLNVHYENRSSGQVRREPCFLRNSVRSAEMVRSIRSCP